MRTELCGYCRQSLEPNVGGIITPPPGGTRFHIVDCWPREREFRSGIPFVTCRECGKAEANEWVKERQDYIREKSLCFLCSFWEQWVERDREGDENIVRVEGTHYHIGDENSRSGFRGFGGSRFHIRFDDGREVISTNLWHQGTIPDHYRARLPDNATFVREAVPA
jgi:hypothetical protein